MSDKGFDGSTVTFGAASLGTLREISYSVDGGEANTTGSSDAVATSQDGVPKITLNVTIVGVGTADVGDAPAAVAIVWNDGGSDGSEAAKWRIKSRESSGSLDSEITTRYQFVPQSIT